MADTTVDVKNAKLLRDEGYSEDAGWAGGCSLQRVHFDVTGNVTVRLKGDKRHIGLSVCFDWVPVLIKQFYVKVGAMAVHSHVVTRRPCHHRVNR
jgi:hypothetical protein